MGERVIINDVGPRDGLQNQPRVLDPEERLELIEALLVAGIRHIEVAAFVSPKAVPAMADADRVVGGLPAVPGACYSVLIPNHKGYELAVAAGARKVAMVLYGSESTARHTANMSRREAEQAARAILQRARGDRVHVAITIAFAFACPFEGPTSATEVERMTAEFLGLGADEVVIADTIGAANPGQVRALMDALVASHGADRLGCHFHDTRAMGLANVFAALESGIRRFDASIGGLGACPYAPGAPGNVATEDVAMMLEAMGYETGIDLGRLVEAVELARDLTGTAAGGRALAWVEHDLVKRKTRDAGAG